MIDIPRPELLDPDRVDRDDREEFTLDDQRSQRQLISKALDESCAYAGQLWEQLDAVREYLLSSLPPDPRRPGPHRSTGAAPTGPDDDDGWTAWMRAFATTTSVLCGAHGDSGFGASRAREEARARRNAPEFLLHAKYRGNDGSGGAPPPGRSGDQPPRLSRSTTRASVLPAALAAAAGFGLRGLLARRRDAPPTP